MNDAASSIDARGLTKKFGDKEAVADMTFQVGRSEIFGFLGPNGAGKTTTTKMLTTLLPPTSGSATVAGSRSLARGTAVKIITDSYAWVEIFLAQKWANSCRSSL